MKSNIDLTISEKVYLSSLISDVLDNIDNNTELDEDVRIVDCSIFLFNKMEDDLRSILEKLGWSCVKMIF